MRFFIVLILLSLAGAGHYFYPRLVNTRTSISSDKRIDEVKEITKERETESESIRNTERLDNDEKNLKSIRVDFSQVKIERVSLPEVTFDNEENDMFLKSKQEAFAKKIKNLGGDIQNKNFQNDLRNELKNASEYREKILMKAKQEMRSQRK